MGISSSVHQWHWHSMTCQKDNKNTKRCNIRQNVSTLRHVFCIQNLWTFQVYRIQIIDLTSITFLESLQNSDVLLWKLMF